MSQTDKAENENNRQLVVYCRYIAATFRHLSTVFIKFGDEVQQGGGKSNKRLADYRRYVGKIFCRLGNLFLRIANRERQRAVELEEPDDQKGETPEKPDENP